MDKPRVISLAQYAPHSSAPNPALIEWLQEKLDEAKRGELQGVVGVSHFSDHEAQYFMMGNLNGYAVQGALHTCLHRLTAAQVGDE
jgi:hypothetical protein